MSIEYFERRRKCYLIDEVCFIFQNKHKIISILIAFGCHNFDVIHHIIACFNESNTMNFVSSLSVQTRLDCDEFAGRRCGALPILVQKDDGPSFSLASPAGLAMFLRDLGTLTGELRVRRAETDLLWYYVASLIPWLPVA